MDFFAPGVIYLFFFILATPVRGLGFFDVSLVSVENKGGRLSDGGCCTGGVYVSSNDSVLCPGICNTIVRVCLLPYHDDYPPVVDDKPHCSYGENSSEHSIGASSFQLSENDPNSITTVGFTFNWPGATTLIIQLNHLRHDGGVQLIQQAVQAIVLNASSTGNWSELHSHTNVNSSSRMRISFTYRIRVRCDTNYYGPNCNTKCVPHDGPHGHYGCNEKGQKYCLPGWADLRVRCTKPICSIGCNGGCDQPGTCSKCPLGWTGPKCNVCKPYPGCVNGYCTVPNECLCKERWGGLQCEDDLDYCFHKSPCLNGATCIPFAPNNYTCECMPGFYGRDCEFEENPCASNPCFNFGTCVVKSKFEYVCVCGRMHSGPNCEHLLAGKGGADPCVIDNNYYKHGDTWELPRCRRCQCVDGYANCTRALCQTGNCLLPTYPCPNDQRCSPVSPDPWSCIRGPCPARSYGQCLPYDYDETNAARRHALCNQSPSTSCTDLTFHLNISNLPIGTYANDICYHLLVFVFERRFSQLSAVCSVDPSSSSTIRIQVVSLKDEWPVNGFRNVIEEALRGNQAGLRSSILRAVLSVQNGSTSNTNDSFWSNSANHALIASITAVGLIICLLSVAAYILWRRMRSPTFVKPVEINSNNDHVTAASPFTMQLNNWTNRGKRCNILAAGACGDAGMRKEINYAMKHPRKSSKSTHEKGHVPDIVMSATDRPRNTSISIRSEDENGLDYMEDAKIRLKSTMVTMEASV